MRYLIYCIFENPPERNIAVSQRADGLPVHVLEKQGLCAAYSEIADAGLSSDMPEILAYHKVIESFFSQATVVPFRFGTVLADQEDITQLLVKRADHYRKILRELEGCAEMGIRAITEGLETQPEGRHDSSEDPVTEVAEPGKLYLSRRNNHYRVESSVIHGNQQATERFCQAFSGLFKKFRSESSKFGIHTENSKAILLSLYFLVPKQSLDRFQQTFARLSSSDSSKLLLSGPWPPYNFVLPGDSPLKSL